MLMDESPTPSPPRPRSEVIESTATSSLPPKHQLDTVKHTDKKTRTSFISESSKSTAPHARSKSLYNSRPSHSSTSKLTTPTTPKGREGVGGGGVGLKKKPTTVSSGQLRPSTGMNGTRNSLEIDQKRKLSSAKR